VRRTGQTLHRLRRRVELVAQPDDFLGRVVERLAKLLVLELEDTDTSAQLAQLRRHFVLSLAATRATAQLVGALTVGLTAVCRVRSRAPRHVERFATMSAACGPFARHGGSVRPVTDEFAAVMGPVSDGVWGQLTAVFGRFIRAWFPSR
jgi:hypothetical protein